MNGDWKSPGGGSFSYLLWLVIFFLSTALDQFLSNETNEGLFVGWL